jgi:peptide/nickel transport system permease protein
MALVEESPVEKVPPNRPAPVDVIPAARRRRPILAALAGLYLVVIAVLCAAAPLLPLPDPDTYQGAVNATPFGSRVLGTDQLGRDILSRVLWGGRVSIFIALVATTIGLLAGLTLGVVAGYFSGWINTVLTGVIDIVLAFPALVLFMIIIATRGPSATNIIIGASIVLTTSFARLARAGAIMYREREFVRAARGLGARNASVLIREVTPNVLPSLFTFALTAAGYVFLIEGGLSFLGLGVPPPTSSWGSMIQGGRPVFRDHPHVVLVPAIVMSLTIVSFNILGDHLRQGRNRQGIERAQL